MISCPYTSGYTHKDVMVPALDKDNKPVLDKENKPVMTKKKDEIPFTLQYRNTIKDWLNGDLSEEQETAIALLEQAFPSPEYTPKASEDGSISRSEVLETVNPLFKPLFAASIQGDTLDQQRAAKEEWLESQGIGGPKNEFLSLTEKVQRSMARDLRAKHEDWSAEKIIAKVKALYED